MVHGLAFRGEGTITLMPNHPPASWKYLERLDKPHGNLRNASPLTKGKGVGRDIFGPERNTKKLQRESGMPFHGLWWQQATGVHGGGKTCHNRDGTMAVWWAKDKERTYGREHAA